jgi:hypothetical protein
MGLGLGEFDRREDDAAVENEGRNEPNQGADGAEKKDGVHVAAFGTQGMQDEVEEGSEKPRCASDGVDDACGFVERSDDREAEADDGDGHEKGHDRAHAPEQREDFAFSGLHTSFGVLFWAHCFSDPMLHTAVGGSEKAADRSTTSTLVLELKVLTSTHGQRARSSLGDRTHRSWKCSGHG